MADPVSAPPSPGVAPVVTHLTRPPGVLPRSGQIWLMLGVAGGIVAIILFTGHEPEPRHAAAVPAPAALAPNPDQLRSYQQRLAEADSRSRAALLPPPELRPVPASERTPGEPRAPRPTDALAEERARREYDSLFASNVVQSPNPTLATEPARPSVLRRSTVTADPNRPAAPPSLDDVAAAVVRASTTTQAGELPVASSASAAASSSASVATPGPTLPTGVSGPPEMIAADGPLHRLVEGTFIDTVLTNRLDGTVAAPVNCLVSTPISTADDQVLIPAGSRLLGTTKPVQSFGETRLAVAFTRLVLPNGRTYSLDHFMGLEAIGDAGLRDQVNHHYTSTFGASAAVGLISGFAQFLTGSGFGTRTSGPVIITGSVGDATAQATSQTMGRFLNRLPNITIREGHRVKVYLTNDLQLPVYQAAPPTRDPGLRLAGKVQP